MIDQHACPMVSISGPDGVGSVMMGSPTVLINNQMACRLGDMVIEKPGLALGPVNPIIMGEMTVMIGEVGMGEPSAPETLAATVGQGGASGGKVPPPATISARSNSYATKPTLAQVISDPHVDAELKRAWNDSNPNVPDVKRGKPGSTKKEQGGWVVWNKKTGKLEVIRVGAGTRDGLGTIVGTRPADTKDREVVAWFHTHPNKASEDYGSGPSPGDIGWQKQEAKVPGIIETHDGRKTIPYP